MRVFAERNGPLFLALALTGVAARVSLAVLHPSSYEIRYYWEDIAERVGNGARLYADTPYHFPPLWAWLLLLFRSVAGHGAPFALLLKGFLILADIATAGCLLRLARREGVPAGRAVALFLANPVGIWVTAVQGQFDNVSLLFLVVAILAFREDEPATPTRSVRAGVPLFLSLAAKQVTALHPLLWLRRRGGPMAALLAYGGVLALLLPYAGEWRAMAGHFFAYGSVARSYGLSEFVLWDSRMGPWISAVGLAAGAAAAWRLSRERLTRASLLLFLVVLFFAPGLGSQYLIWPLVFGALRPCAGYFLFSATALAWILGSHYSVPGSGRWMGHLVWLAVAFWGLREARALPRGRREAGALQKAPLDAAPAKCRTSQI